MALTMTRKIELDVEDLYYCLVENGDLTDFAPCEDVHLLPDDLTPEFSYRLFTALAQIAKERMEEEEE